MKVYNIILIILTILIILLIIKNLDISEHWYGNINPAILFIPNKFKEPRCEKSVKLNTTDC